MQMASVKIFEGANTPIGLKNQKRAGKIIYYGLLRTNPD